MGVEGEELATLASVVDLNLCRVRNRLEILNLFFAGRGLGVFLTMLLTLIVFPGDFGTDPV